MNFIKNWLHRIKKNIDPRTKEQLITSLHNAKQHNLFSAETLGMIEGALQMSEQHVRDVMVPRSNMIVLELHESPENLVKIIVESGHSRFPVIGDNRDDVQGIFLAKDLLDYYAKGTDTQFDMPDVMRPAIFIPESKRLNILLREFRTSRNHMAIIVDEYSGVAGLVTIEDVIEQIIGEIDDEHDIDDQVFISQRKDGSCIIRALTPIEEFNEYFKTNLSNEEFDTISGLLLQAFGHLPKRGEKIELGGFSFEVIRADSRRINLLRVK
ncbi:transporter associated domain-containing protein [Candidatus Halobeggiatoa sp. HSG11]|nr:transporter associated domain-containing protein [Candidatus Halobeggiatoa sp. HSG11]